MELTFNQQLKTYQQAAEDYLSRCFTDETLPQQTLFAAMRYSLLAGGKRIRPVLVLEFCRLCGGDWHKALDFAAALEMIHTYSLIHDDLPCMDNDDYRRGRLTNHKVFGEAQAVLAGDGLLTAAFSTAAGADAPPETIAAVVKTLADCAGPLGMVGGQVLDMEGEQKQLDAQGLLDIHSRKTGALIVAACTLGVLAARGTQAQLDAARQYAEALGLAFQIKDDMLLAHFGYQLFHILPTEDAVPEDIGCNDHMACTCLQVSCRIFRCDPASDLHSSGIGRQR